MHVLPAGNILGRGSGRHIEHLCRVLCGGGCERGRRSGVQQLPEQHLLIEQSQCVPAMPRALDVGAWGRKQNGLQMQCRLYGA